MGVRLWQEGRERLLREYDLVLKQRAQTLTEWASQSTIIKLVAVSQRLEQMAEHVGELWDDKVLGSKMSTCRLVQQRQREAVQQLSELRVRMQRRGLQSKSAPILNASEQMRVVSELER